MNRHGVTDATEEILIFFSKHKQNVIEWLYY